MWSSSGSPATLPRHTAGSADPVDWDSLLPLLPESVRLLRQVLEDDAALHRLLEHCGGLTLRIPRRFPSEGHLLRALLPEPVLRRLLGAYGGTCLYIPRCARLARPAALPPSPGGAVMPVRRRKKALEKALHERLQRLTEHLDTAEVSEKSIDIVKEIKELHALARTLEQEGTSQDGDRKPPAPLRVIWAGQEPEDGLP